MIEVTKLVKRFGMKAVLRGMDFNVQPGEFVARVRLHSCASWPRSPDLRWVR